MKTLKNILTTLAVSSGLLFFHSSASAVVAVNRMHVADKVEKNDLYGFWINMAENEDGSLINATAMHSDGTGVDTMVLKVKAEKKSDIIVRKFTWTFDEEQQMFRQTVTDYRVVRNGKEQRDKKEIGKTNTVKVRMLIVRNRPNTLDLTDEASGRKMHYFKQNPEEFLHLLGDAAKYQ